MAQDEPLLEAQEEGAREEKMGNEEADDCDKKEREEKEKGNNVEKILMEELKAIKDMIQSTGST